MGTSTTKRSLYKPTAGEDGWAATVNANMDVLDEFVGGINGGIESVSAVGNTGTSQTIALTTGNIITYTVNGNCTFTMPSGLTSGKGISFTVILTDSGGPRNITFTGVKWSGGTDPTVMSAASAIDIYTFLTIDGGTTWYGFTGGTSMAT